MPIKQNFYFAKNEFISGGCICHSFYNKENHVKFDWCFWYNALIAYWCKRLKLWSQLVSLHINLSTTERALERRGHNCLLSLWGKATTEKPPTDDWSHLERDLQLSCHFISCQQPRHCWLNCDPWNGVVKRNTMPFSSDMFAFKCSSGCPLTGLLWAFREKNAP